MVVPVDLEDTDAGVLRRATHVDPLLLVYFQQAAAIQRHRGVVKIAVTIIHCQDSDRALPVREMIRMIEKCNDS